MIQFVVFSRCRPLQLHGYLTSLFKHVEPTTDVSVSVLVRGDPHYVSAYDQLRDEFPQCRWVSEGAFGDDLAKMIDSGAEYTCFGCDDVVFTGQVLAPEVVMALQPDVLGMSLRLGAHIQRDMFGGHMPQPIFDGYLRWSVTEGQGDWGYPWEVLGTVYEAEFVQRIVERTKPQSPSQLEALGARCWFNETDKRRMASFGQSRLVVPTVNIVQSEYPNGIKGGIELSPEFLLECWNSGLRLDITRYEGMTPASWRVPDFYLRRIG